MKDAGRSFMIKYGLAKAPCAERMQAWGRAVRVYLERGDDFELAGVFAANALFPDYRSCVYRSEPDTAEALLRLAERM